MASNTQASARPVFGGLLPQQIDVLRRPICVDDVAIHPFHKWPYVKGVTAINKLNKIFGFDGWSTRNVQVQMVDKSAGMEKDKKSGKDVMMFASTFTCTVELEIRTPGGRTFVRVGVGADQKKSSNFIDTVDNAIASALTYAIRNAAITLGHQFGLAVQRLKLKDANGHDIDWRRLCVTEPTQYPDLVLLSRLLDGQAFTPDGGTFDPSEVERDRLAAQAAADDGAEGDAGRAADDEHQAAAPAAQPAAPQQAATPASAPATEQRAAAQAPAEQAAPAQQQTQAPATQQPQRQASQPAAEGPPAQGSGPTYEQRRKECIEEIRKLWQTLGREPGGKLWAEICEANGRKGLMPVQIAKKADEGGPSDELLVALRAAFRKAAEGGRAAA